MSFDHLRNDGIAYFQHTRPNEYSTTIVVGAPRSGTTMVSTALSCLGVFIGDDVGKGVYEDARIARAIEKEPETLPQIISEYNRRHNVWAFKRPLAYARIEKHLTEFRDPRIIAVFRDPISIACRTVASTDVDFREQLNIVTKRNTTLTEFVLRQEIPVMMVSYEKALHNPKTFALALSDFVGINPDQRQIREAEGSISNGPKTYLMSSQTRFPKTDFQPRDCESEHQE